MRQPTTTERGLGSRWQRLRPLVLRRDRYRCACGNYADTVDHVVPRVEGGAPYDPANLRARCRRCNYGDGGRLAHARRARRTLGLPSRQW